MNRRSATRTHSNYTYLTTPIIQSGLLRLPLLSRTSSTCKGLDPSSFGSLPNTNLLPSSDFRFPLSRPRRLQYTFQPCGTQNSLRTRRREARPSDKGRPDRRPTKTAKTHSQLFRSVATNILCNKRGDIPDSHVAKAIKSHRSELRKEKKAKSKVRLDERHNIYVARKREPKTLHPGQTITKSFTVSKSNTKAPSKPVADSSSSERKVFAEVLNDTPSTLLSNDIMSSTVVPVATAGAPEGEYKENAPISNILMCPDCKEYPPNLVEEFSNGDMVCSSCGLVVSYDESRLGNLQAQTDQLTHGAGWRSDC